jgi:serine/threonine protein kinase
VDLWSLGCVLAHIYLGKPLFDGDNDMAQIGMIMTTLHDQIESWPEAKSLPYFMDFSGMGAEKQLNDVSG